MRVGHWVWIGLAVCLGVGCSSASGDVTQDVGQEVAGDQVGADVGERDVGGEVKRPDAEADETGPGWEYLLDDQLKLNHIQVKGTHNSYHLRPEEIATPDWDYEHAPLRTQLEEYGVRQVELDVHWEPGVGFRVYHVPVLDDVSSCDTFVECLSEVKQWSDEHPWHVPLFILVEPKDDIDPPNKKIAGHYGDLDAEIFSVWPRERLVMPDDVRGEYGTLQEAALAGNWPVLGACRGKAVFIMLDHTEHAQGYLTEDVLQVGRPLFIMEMSEQPWTAFWEVGNALTGKDKIAGLVEMGYMLRTAADSTNPDKQATNAEQAESARTSGAHVISSDYPAEVAGGYWFDLGEGRSSRCNPLTAPAICTAEAVEIGLANEVR